jgi:DNA-binding MarR family transcriptional regulator
MSHYDTGTYRIRSSIGYLLRRGASLLRDELDRDFAGHDISFVHWVTLMIVREDPQITAGEICRHLHYDAGAFTRILDQLEKRGLLRRCRSNEDRRVVQLRVTPAGSRAAASLLPLVVGRLNYALQEFTAAEVATLAGLLGRLIQRLEGPHAARKP